MRVMLLFMVIVALGGCATVPESVHMTYLSDPPLATIYDGDRYIGQAPVSIDYAGRIAKHVLPGGRRCFVTRPVTARWESGATRVKRFILACAEQGPSQQFVLTRPNNAPDLNVDLAFATGDERALSAAKQQQEAEYEAHVAQQQRDARIAQEVIEDVLAVGLGVVGAHYEPSPPTIEAVPASHTASTAATIKAVSPPLPAVTHCTGSAVGNAVTSVQMNCVTTP